MGAARRGARRHVRRVSITSIQTNRTTDPTIVAATQTVSTVYPAPPAGSEADWNTMPPSSTATLELTHVSSTVCTRENLDGKSGHINNPQTTQHITARLHLEHIEVDDGLGDRSRGRRRGFLHHHERRPTVRRRGVRGTAQYLSSLCLGSRPSDCRSMKEMKRHPRHWLRLSPRHWTTPLRVCDGNYVKCSGGPCGHCVCCMGSTHNCISRLDVVPPRTHTIGARWDSVE